MFYDCFVVTSMKLNTQSEHISYVPVLLICVNSAILSHILQMYAKNHKLYPSIWTNG